MRRPARLVGTLALSLTCLTLGACGGTSDDTATPGVTTPGATTSGATPPGATPPAVTPSGNTTPPGATPDGATPSDSPSASAPATPAACPITPTTVAPPPGVSTDLSVKPTVAANPAPAPDAVQVADVVVGTGTQAQTLDKVAVKYVGTLYSTGAEFDSSWKTSPDNTLDLNVCATGTIPGFAIAPEGMKVGGRRVVTIPPLYGYGAEGSGSTIPPNSTLVFVIDLVSVAPPAG